MTQKIPRALDAYSRDEIRAWKQGAGIDEAGAFAQAATVDREQQRRDQIRRELVREWFDADPAGESSDSTGLATRLGRLLKLS